MVCTNKPVCFDSSVFYANLLPLLDCQYNIGSPTKRVDNIYLCGDIIASAPDFNIFLNTVDGADTGAILFNAGGGIGVSRGAQLQLFGNENAGTGIVILEGGDVAGASLILRTNHATPNIIFATNSINRWQIEGSAGILQGTQAVNLISTNTVDAADTASIAISGGGDLGVSRGAFLQVYGNEAGGGNGGAVVLDGGDVASGSLYIRTHDSGASIFLFTDSLLRWSVTGNGVFLQDPTNGSDFQMTRANTSVAVPVADGVAAAGTIITDATDLTKQITNVTTVGAGEGVQLWGANLGTVFHVTNRGANALLVYPHSGVATINGGAGGAAISLATNTLGIFLYVSANTYVAFEVPLA